MEESVFWNSQKGKEIVRIKNAVFVEIYYKGFAEGMKHQWYMLLAVGV